MPKLSVVALGLAVVLFGGVACSSDLVVDKGDVAKQVSTQLGGQVGHEPESVTCPSDLSAKVGTTLKCELSDSGQTYGVTVTVTSVVDKDVKFDIKVDDEPS